MRIRLGKKWIGNNLPSLIVAELSGNHNGNFLRIKKLIAEAKKAGADIVGGDEFIEKIKDGEMNFDH